MSEIFSKSRALNELMDVMSRHSEVKTPSQMLCMYSELQNFLKGINDTAFEEGYLKGVEIKDQLK